MVPAELTPITGRVVNHAKLLAGVCGPVHAGGIGPVRTIVKSLRDKLGDEAAHPTYIFNEPRIGYRLWQGDDGVIVGILQIARRGLEFLCSNGPQLDYQGVWLTGQPGWRSRRV